MTSEIKKFRITFKLSVKQLMEIIDFCHEKDITILGYDGRQQQNENE